MEQRTIVLFLFIALTPALLLGQEEWKSRQDKSGIVIQTRSSDYSEFDEFKAVTLINQSLDAFVAVILDIDRIPDWMHSVEHSRLLERTGDTLQVYYTEASVPFPLKNRDGIYRNRLTWDPAEQTLLVAIEILPDYLEKKDKLVRISQGRGFWKARVIGPKLLELTFQMQVDPGGSIPTWLANMFVVDTPFETLVKLKEIIGEEKYAEAQFGFLRK